MNDVMTPQPQFSSLSLCSYHILSLKAPLLSYLWTYPWRRIWQPTPVSLPGEPRGQRSLAGYSPWNRKESDTTEVTYHTCSNPCLESCLKGIQEALLDKMQGEGAS